MPTPKILAALVLAGLLAAGCTATDRPTTQVSLPTVEQQKRDIAGLRDRGVITYEEAARRQFELQRNAYALTEGEYSFWRDSIRYARQVDLKQITKAQYRTLVAKAYQDYVVLKKPGKPRIYG